VRVHAPYIIHYLFIKLRYESADVGCVKRHHVYNILIFLLHFDCGVLFFGRLLCLGLVWDSYRLVVRAVAYSVLVPPACLAELLRPYVDLKLACCFASQKSTANARDHLLDARREEEARVDGHVPPASAPPLAAATATSNSTKCRFWIGFVAWVVLLAFSISTAVNGTGGAVVVPTTGALVILGLAFLGVLFGISERNTGNNNAAAVSGKAPTSDVRTPSTASAAFVWEGRALPLDDSRSYRVRVTWPNVLALVSVILEALQLSALCITAVLMDKTSSSNDSVSTVVLPEWLTSVASALSFSTLSLSTDTATDWARVAWICVAVWMVVVTLPLAHQESSASSSASSPSSNSDARPWRRSDPVAAPVDLVWSESSSGLSRGAMAAAQEKCARAKAIQQQQQQQEQQQRTRRQGGSSDGAHHSESAIASSLPFRHATAFLGSVAFLSLVLVLQPGGTCWQNLKPGASRATSAFAFLYYLITTQVAR